MPGGYHRASKWLSQNLGEEITQSIAGQVGDSGLITIFTRCGPQRQLHTSVFDAMTCRAKQSEICNGCVAYAPGSAQGGVDAQVFLPIEIVNPTRSEPARPVLPNSVLPDCLLEIEIAGGHRLRVSGSYDPEMLARLIRGLSG